MSKPPRPSSPKPYLQSKAPGARRSRDVLGGTPCQIADLVILCCAFLCLAILPYLASGQSSITGFLQLRVSLRNVLVGSLCLCTWRVILVSVAVYTRRRMRSVAGYSLRLLIALNSCTAVVGMVIVLLRPQANVWRAVAVFWAFSVFSMSLVRLVLLAYDRIARPVLRRRRKLIIVGSGLRAAQLYAKLEKRRDLGYRLIGFVETEATVELSSPELIPADSILGRIDNLERILRQHAVDEVLVALPLNTQPELVGHSLAVCQMLDIPSQYVTNFFGTPRAREAPAPRLR